MSYYPPCENGTKVNMIKQKFELNASPKEKQIQRAKTETDEEQRDSLRRSLSASPVKSKKTSKPNVSRQLSNPSKNIKRTPAFRGDKLSRTKNLQSPTKERLVSIVDRNVKIFEEKPEYGKIGNVKKKNYESLELASESGISNSEAIDEIHDYGRFNGEKTGNIYNSRRDLKPLTAKDTRLGDNTVRTTVISRQKNISPIFTREDDIENSRANGQPANRQAAARIDKFFKNGAEYTKVTKQSKSNIHDDNIARFIGSQENSRRNASETTGVLDIREELSRRTCQTAIDDDEEDEEFAVHRTTDAIDGAVDDDFITRKFNRHEDNSLTKKSSLASEMKNVVGLRLTDTLKAALQAPLPAGPPPKKPPRTFAHSPAVRRYDGNRSENDRTETNASHSDEENSRFSEETKSREKTGIRNILSRSPISDGVPSSLSPKPAKSRESRDSKKMLEKLEHVLIQHQKALGPKVIMARKDKREKSNGFDRKDGTMSDSEKRDKRCFYNRLSRTLEDSKKLGSLPKVPDSKAKKHSTFDCLPSLNCASSSIYEQVKNPDFKSYFAETTSLRESRSSKSDGTPETSITNLLSGNSEFYDDLATSPASKRLSTELSTFLDGKRRQTSALRENEERVYAEPFAYDKNSGTDITKYGILSPEEHNYFSRSLQEERFGSCKENAFLSSKQNSYEKTGSSKPELHYMCTSIRPLVYEDNNNETEDVTSFSKIQRSANSSRSVILNMDNPPVRTEPDKLNKIKVEQLLNQAFGKFVMAGSETPTDSNTSSDTDSNASNPSMSDEVSSFNDKLRLFKNRENGMRSTKDELHRSLTEKRKNYVRRVSSKYSERREAGSLIDRRNKLFEVCLLVELNLSTKQPYIKDKYPIYAKTPAWIENFCFPDATDWPPSDSNQNQFYSLVLMDERGNRRYGYCCRVRPEDGPILPLAYCLITKYRASGFYQKVLLELESRHGLPDKLRRSFIEELYNSPMPKPGQSLRMTADENERVTDGCSMPEDKTSYNNLILSKFIDSNDKLDSAVRHNTAELSSALISNERTISESMMVVLNDSDCQESVIIRSGDPRLEERDMSQLFDNVSNKVLIILFGSLLLERKVVLLCDKLSTLSSCVEALQSLLYPFTWPHTFIPVLPDIPGLSEILQAPLPFVIGILKSKNSVNAEVASMKDAIVVDLDTSKIVHAMGDESSILPSRLQKGIRSALQLVSSNTKSGDGIRNFLVSEAFLRVFVETCSHCDSHLVTQQDGKVIFQKESFAKASSSKTVQYFLEWFVETTMFTTFVEDCIARMEGSSSHGKDDVKLFYQRVAEYQRGADRSAQSKKSCPKKKTLGDRLKDLTNFHA